MRFEFGRNWQDYVDRHFTRERLDAARSKLLDFLKLPDLQGKVFLDIGCGSGLHSMAALQAGAAGVVSFDYDPRSVAATQTLKDLAGSPDHWTVEQGSVLDVDFLRSLPRADIVYSWGVLHHTGQMWQAIENAASLVTGNSLFYIALYTSDLFIDRTPGYWLDVKRRYNQSGYWGRLAWEVWYALRFDMVPQLVRLRNPLKKWLEYRRQPRGMSYWTDLRDWLGGWPMEFAGVRETLAFCRDRLQLECLNLATGEACSEYLFRRQLATNHWDAVLAQQRVQPLVGPFRSDGGPCYVADLPERADEADAGTGGTASHWILFEEGQPLGLAHCLPDQIRRAGCGRYVDRGTEVYFSASDNSDPNTNGRRYELRRL